MPSNEFPYSTTPERNPIAYSMPVKGQMDKYKSDEKRQKAPPILPFELEQITQELGNAFIALAELRNMLSRAQKDTNIPDMPVDAIKEKIDKINELILDIPEDLAKIGI
tara:strand:+ start:452 stop:778 length:327 start_codon:yes stop_codon:yes gene_type:complete